ncbi:ribosomal protein S5 domain 2-type protein [Entophlyctis helioformis]|nr:ribosomal protein S5 domain 2-type protein [Entophlyctis helioformis]
MHRTGITCGTCALVSSGLALALHSPCTRLDAHSKRYATLVETFEKQFGKRPDFFARSPGRVNLIGEHIDYAGYSVLPMAIDRDVVVAVATKETQGTAQIVIGNTEADKYPTRSFEHDNKEYIAIDSAIHEWSNYFKCGYKGAFEGVKLASAKSFDAVISGTVPGGAGVSSSSAFVCASAVATLTANDAQLNKGELTQAAIRGERYAGVQTGGMDQSISIMGQKGSALLIHFYPSLSAAPIAFPASEDVPVFVIANTLVTADKHVTAPTNYNLRVVETRLGAALLAKKLGLVVPDEVITFRDVHSIVFKDTPFEHNETAQLAELQSLVEKHFKHEPYLIEDVAAELGLTVDEVKAKYIGSIVIRADDFKLYQRAKHVFSEARRVFMFRDVCAKKESFSGHLLQDLGKLMNESQDSCRDLFNCSCDEINELTTIARGAGAFGSRLTGAGWGGCTVSLVAEKNVPAFIEKVKEDYYFTKWPAWKSDPAALAKLDDYIFASKPGIGAAVLRNLDL